MAFQSPAQNYRETRLNLGDLVSLSAYSTYLMRSDCDIPDAGIVKGSVLAIDRALTPAHGQLIVAEVDGELTLRRLLLTPVPALQALDSDETVTLIDVSQPLPSGAWSPTPSPTWPGWDSADRRGSDHVCPCRCQQFLRFLRNRVPARPARPTHRRGI